MRILISGVLSVALTISSVALAAPKDKVAPSDSMHTEYLANLDKMVHLWYIRQNIDSTVLAETFDYDSAQITPECPDSIYMQRLAKLNTLIELPFNSIVRNYISVYTQRKRSQVGVMLGLTEYYFPIFEEILDSYQLPVELRILPVIESALNPRAVSRGGATGLWQFMYTTGRKYNLQIDSYVDARRDPIAATHAAARYLRDLYDMYGDWTLVIAAYNCGPGNVNKAIRRAGGKRDYWDIYYFLPRETRGYVPAFIAANYAMNYAAEHRITPVQLTLPKTTDTIVVNGRMHLQQVAEVLEIPVQQLRDLNPQYKHDLLPSTTSNIIRLPFEHVGAFIDRETEIRTYKDSLFLSPQRIREPLKHKDVAFADAIPGSGNAIKYKVRQGDVLGSIASRYKVTVKQLKMWNGISGHMIRVGQTLLIYSGKSQS